MRVSILAEQSRTKKNFCSIFVKIVLFYIMYNVFLSHRSSQKDPGMSSTNTQGGKMKSKKFTSHHVASRKDEDEDEPFEMPQLRTEFTLPVKDMPTFNFNMPKSTPQRTTIDLSSQAYTFSTPIQKMPVTPTDTPTGPPKMVCRILNTQALFIVLKFIIWKLFT